MATTGQQINYLVGTMQELPRAAICANDLAAEAEFFSFGTNDLTQTALGIIVMMLVPFCTITPMPKSMPGIRLCRSTARELARW